MTRCEKGNRKEREEEKENEEKEEEKREKGNIPVNKLGRRYPWPIKMESLTRCVLFPF